MTDMTNDQRNEYYVLKQLKLLNDLKVLVQDQPPFEFGTFNRRGPRRKINEIIRISAQLRNLRDELDEAEEAEDQERIEKLRRQEELDRLAEEALSDPIRTTTL